MKSMIKHFFVLFLVVAVGSALLMGCGGNGTDNGAVDNGGTSQNETPGEKPEDVTDTIVDCHFVDAQPSIDGSGDEEVWMNIEPTTVELESGMWVDVKTYYDNDNIYFLYDWISDMTMTAEDSTAGFWKKDAEGNWTWDSKMDTLSIVWDLSDIPGFLDTGCTPLCHDQSNIVDNRYMATEIPGDIVELWVWSPAVSGMKNIMASYILTDIPAGTDTEDPDFDNKIAWEKLPGEYGFFYNRDANEKKPAEGGEGAPLYIITENNPSGEAALVQAVGRFDFGGYILEVARPRNPSNRDLVHFEVSDNGYADFFFAMAMHSLDDRENHKTQESAATLRMIGKSVAE